MPAPRIERLADALVAAGLAWSVIPEDFRAASVFVVTTPGDFGGRRFVAGELLRADGAPEEGEPILLVARDPARPRLGTVVRGRLFGDLGEPCSPVRWGVAGGVGASVVHPPLARWLERGRVAPASVPRMSSWRDVAASAQQMLLFGAAVPA